MFRNKSLKYKGFDGYVAQVDDWCWGDIGLGNSHLNYWSNTELRLRFYPESIESSQSLFEQTADDAIQYFRSLPSDKLLKLYKEIFRYSVFVNFITYKAYQDKKYIRSDIPDIECIEFIAGLSGWKLPFLQEQELHELNTLYPIHERKEMNKYVPNYEDTVHFQIIPWKDIYNLIKHS